MKEGPDLAFEVREAEMADGDEVMQASQRVR